jgi:hypothetical protein
MPYNVSIEYIRYFVKYFSISFETFLTFLVILSDKEIMEGMTVTEIAKALEISIDAARKRIETAGIRPITREAIYHPDVIEVLRDVRMGRPKKAKPEAEKK